MGSSCCVMNCGLCCIVDCCIGDFCSDGGGCSYSPSRNNSDSSANKIANELAKMKKKYSTSSEKEEKDIAKVVGENMNEFIGWVKNINETKYGGRSLNINIKGIEEKRQELLKQIVGCIGNKMNERLVLTDKELSVILKEPNDETRKENFENFCKKVQEEAKEKLKKKIVSVVEAQQEMVQKEIKNRLDEVTRSMKDSQKELENVVKASNKGTKEKEAEQLKMMYKHAIYDLLGEKLGI